MLLASASAVGARPVILNSAKVNSRLLRGTGVVSTLAGADTGWFADTKTVRKVFLKREIF